MQGGTAEPCPKRCGPKSIVSSEMARSVAERNGVHMDDTFTGFKFLAERMKYYQNGEKTVLFAYERL